MSSNTVLAEWEATSKAAVTGVSKEPWKKFSNANNQKGMRSLQAPEKAKNNTQRNMTAATKLAFRKSRKARKARKTRKTHKNNRR